MKKVIAPHRNTMTFLLVKKKFLINRSRFEEVYKATWINYCYDDNQQKYNKERKVVLKRTYNSNDKIVDILNEIK